MLFRLDYTMMLLLNYFDCLSYYNGALLCSERDSIICINQASRGSSLMERNVLLL